MPPERCVATTILPRTARHKRDALIVGHMPKVRGIAASVRHMFSPSIPFEDLVQCGNLGLVKAAGQYNPSRGDFATYAYRKIRGAIIDAHKRKAYQEELHDSLEALQGVVGGKLAGLENRAMRRELTVDPSPLPDALAVDREMLALAKAAIELLSDDERVVLVEALAGAQLKGIAAACGHSVPWVKVRLSNGCKNVEAVVQELRKVQKVKTLSVQQRKDGGRP